MTNENDASEREPTPQGGVTDGERTKAQEATRLLSAGVAHDLNNILTGFVSYPELMVMELPEDSPLVAYATAMQTAGQLAAELTHQLKVLACGIKGKRQECRLDLILEACLASPELRASSSMRADVRIDVAIDPSVPVVQAVPEALAEVVKLLLEQAHLSATARVGIAVKVERGAGDHRSAQPGCVRVSVSDDGREIEQRHLARFFEPYYARRVLGRPCAGLGLAIAERVAMDLGGTIAVRSSVRGTVVELVIPCEGAG
ncbi:MAG TPA: HAMP domain-containing sensor histidine kinase [Polyangiaceae bacterium]|nr:HAMP domain-containing sensor histidine kinase [Polyangiaceae bacterium]